MPEQNEKTTAREQLPQEGGKGNWKRVVSEMPTDPDDDPKENEPRKGDMSVREGEAGDGAPR